MATSLAKVGPLSAPSRGVKPFPPSAKTARMTSVMRSRESFSMPLLALTNSISGVSEGRIS